jgi:hypothetical protein
MRKLIALTIVFMITISAMAQDNTAKPEKPVEVKISGFIMNNLFYDNRKNLDALDGLVLLYPLHKNVDSLGEDLNKVPNLNLLAFASRLRFGVTGPDAFGAKTSALIEFDFTGRGNCASVRFRQGWIKLNWEKTELLVGRAWHPLVVMDVIPSVQALGMGAPFQPFNRSEQITMTRKMGSFNLILSAIFQNDYINNGPFGKSYLYQNNAIVPNLHVQMKYKTDNVIAGAGIDYKRLKPRTYVISPVGKDTSETDAVVNCLTFIAYAQVKTGMLTVSSKAIFAENTSEDLMTGAYGISSYDTLTGKEQYTPFHHLFVWGNVSYGGKLKASIFVGFLKNLGTSENLVSVSKYTPTVVYGLGEDISQMLRITPTISYTFNKLVVALEVEHNIEEYGKIDTGNKGKIINTTSVSGTRILASLCYNF